MSKKNVKISCYLAIALFLLMQLLNIGISTAVSYSVSLAILLDIAYDRFF